MKVRKTLKRADRRSFKIEEVFTSPSTRTIRNSIMNFIVGGSIRRIQQENKGEKQENYSFLIHTEQSRNSHNWQEEVVNKLNEELVRIAKEDQALFNVLVEEAYNDLKPSVELSGLQLPIFSVVLHEV